MLAHAPPMRARKRLLLIALASGIAGSSSAQEHAQPDPFEAVVTADPMELARVVDRLGDGAVIARLGEEKPRAVRLAAARATPFLREPERALEALAVVAAGRDPLLAPAAAHAALTITRALDPDELARREVDPASLIGARDRLAALAQDESARPDLRIAAGIARERLEALGARSPG